ncbi:hypothetical protein OKA05_00075 [Luteolibacter arcticus]|uniref:General secretion pathway protein L n=1 Tax=Luteolibacter arcticus TaxID=1581411 RepID=A0ABT3GBB7_9BACT|nr:hypothetical protein [Luteolibacter arcticus]MCW1920927.1 hypothetical protein [Luteolibacter arcticus]
MSKQQEMSLLVPGVRGWEIWKQATTGGFVLQSADGPARASELTNLPGGNLAMLFPVRGFHALPFKASSADDSLFDDLAAMHAERLGVRADPMAGQLSDTFLITKEEESATLLGVVLKSPGDGDLPPRSPKEFDLSARAYPVRGEAIAVWMEFGRWVFAIFRNGKLLYSQATSSGGAAPDGACLKEIQLALGQMAIQGLQIKPEAVHVWSPEGDAGSAGSLTDAFHVPVKVTPRPDPVLPEPRSKLLPADVRAARRAAKSQQQKVAAIAAVALAYLGVGGWFGYGLWKDHSQIKKLTAEAESIAPEDDRMAYEKHLAMWSELDLVVDGNKAPVELMSRVAKAIPLNQVVRLKLAEINANEIKLDGEALQAGPASQFGVTLTRSLPEFKWETPPPSSGSKGWTFRFNGTRPDSNLTP